MLSKYNLWYTPHAVAVTTRIVTFLVGNPYKPSFVTVTGRGVDQYNIPMDPMFFVEGSRLGRIFFVQDPHHDGSQLCQNLLGLGRAVPGCSWEA